MVGEVSKSKLEKDKGKKKGDPKAKIKKGDAKEGKKGEAQECSFTSIELGDTNCVR